MEDVLPGRYRPPRRTAPPPPPRPRGGPCPKVRGRAGASRDPPPHSRAPGEPRRPRPASGASLPAGPRLPPPLPGNRAGAGGGTAAAEGKLGWWLLQVGPCAGREEPGSGRWGPPVPWPGCATPAARCVSAAGSSGWEATGPSPGPRDCFRMNRSASKTPQPLPVSQALRPCRGEPMSSGIFVADLHHHCQPTPSEEQSGARCAAAAPPQLVPPFFGAAAHAGLLPARPHCFSPLLRYYSSAWLESPLQPLPSCSAGRALGAISTKSYWLRFR